jgi:hypothetical protein
MLYRIFDIYIDEKGRKVIQFDTYDENPNLSDLFIAKELPNGDIKCFSDNSSIVDDEDAERPIRGLIGKLFGGNRKIKFY